MFARVINCFGLKRVGLSAVKCFLLRLCNCFYPVFFYFFISVHILIVLYSLKFLIFIYLLSFHFINFMYDIGLS